MNKFSWKYIIPFYGIYAVYKSPEVDKKNWYIVSIIITLLSISLFGTSNKENSTSKDVVKEEQKPSKEISYKVGDLIKTEKFELKILSVTKRKSIGSQYMAHKANEGASFIIVTYQFKNISNKPISSVSEPEVDKLIDPNGTKYDENSSATTQHQLISDQKALNIDDINPGITIKDSKVFEIADEVWKNPGWKINFNADEDFLVAVP